MQYNVTFQVWMQYNVTFQVWILLFTCEIYSQHSNNFLTRGNKLCPNTWSNCWLYVLINELSPRSVLAELCSFIYFRKSYTVHTFQRKISLYRVVLHIKKQLSYLHISTLRRHIQPTYQHVWDISARGHHQSPWQPIYCHNWGLQ